MLIEFYHNVEVHESVPILQTMKLRPKDVKPLAPGLLFSSYVLQQQASTNCWVTDTGLQTQICVWCLPLEGHSPQTPSCCLCRPPLSSQTPNMAPGEQGTEEASSLTLLALSCAHAQGPRLNVCTSCPARAGAGSLSRFQES